MRRIAIATAWAAACVLFVVGPRPAAADILVNVSKSSQRMSVLVDGTARYNWTVSTGTERYTTPSGVYKPQWLARKWRSKQYADAPMPHSIFFNKGYAVHGTTEISRLGKAASHGCVRLHPDNAARLYELVEKHMANTRVVVSDDVIEAPSEAPKKKPSQFMAKNTAGEKPAAAAAEKIPEAKAAATANTRAKARAETTAVRQERKNSARGTYREAQRYREAQARYDRYGFRW